jgi:hypothetical protein
LKDTAERIKAVDRAASMIEEILKQGTTSESISVPFSSSTGQVILSLYLRSMSKFTRFWERIEVIVVRLLYYYIINSA